MRSLFICNCNHNLLATEKHVRMFQLWLVMGKPASILRKNLKISMEFLE